MLNIILFGAPGAGKGTQAKMLAKKYNLNHVSTGEVIRSEIRNGSSIGAELAEHIANGELAPDELVINMIEEYINSHQYDAGNIFDGFPRTTEQAKAFDKILKDRNDSVNIMLSLEVPDEELINRLLIRGKDGQRPEDKEEKVITNRLNIYKKVTAIVAEYYNAQGKYVAIDGTGSIDSIFNRLCEEIDKTL